MADDLLSVHAAQLHELAEGLQTTGAYLAAARRLSRGEANMDRSAAEVIEKAMGELARANAAFHHFREQLSGISPDEIGFGPCVTEPNKGDDSSN